MVFLDFEQLYLFIRIIIAGICGIIIGLERKNRAKEAGIRTHCIVACASALMMIISKYGFSDMVMSGDVRLDPSRMAQGIVTGVGFLGAGMIYFQRGVLIGLTTASGIWAVSGIGMAIGAGMYVLGVSATILILLIQLIFHSRNKIVNHHKSKTLNIYNVTEKDFQKSATDMLLNIEVAVTDTSVKKYAEGLYDYIFQIEMPEEMSEEKLLDLFSYEASVDFNN